MIYFFPIAKRCITQALLLSILISLARESDKKKYWLVKWSVVCRPKDQGGLGVHDLQVKNSALLGKWLFKLLTEDGVWKTLLK
jgi:hypothetical protein